MKKTALGASVLLLALATSLAGITKPLSKVAITKSTPLSERNPRTRAEQKLLDASVPTDYSFVSELWNGNNAPYHLIRLHTDHLLQAGRNAESLLPEAKTTALQNPNDAHAQFLWAYLAYQAQEAGIKHASQISNRASQEASLLTAIRNLDYVRVALAEVTPPHAYDYSRIRFLVGANTDQATEQIKPLGIRLLRHDPTDSAVRSVLFSLLQPGISSGDMNLGLTLTHTVHSLTIKSLETQKQIADLYEKNWSNRGFHQVDASKAIAEQREYLALLPVNSPLRQVASQNIEHIQTMQAFEDERRKQGIDDFPSK